MEQTCFVLVDIFGGNDNFLKFLREDNIVKYCGKVSGSEKFYRDYSENNIPFYDWEVVARLEGTHKDLRLTIQKIKEYQGVRKIEVLTCDRVS